MSENDKLEDAVDRLRAEIDPEILRLQAGNTIALIEDNPEHIGIVETNFELEGSLNVVVARTLEEARQRFLVTKPSVYIIDHRLPDGYGLDFAKEIRRAEGFYTEYTAKTGEKVRKYRPLTGIFMLSAQDEIKVPVEASQWAIDYHMKPFVPEMMPTIQGMMMDTALNRAIVLKLFGQLMTDHLKGNIQVPAQITGFDGRLFRMIFEAVPVPEEGAFLKIDAIEGVANTTFLNPSGLYSADDLVFLMRRASEPEHIHSMFREYLSNRRVGINFPRPTFYYVGEDAALDGRKYTYAPVPVLFITPTKQYIRMLSNIGGDRAELHQKTLIRAILDKTMDFYLENMAPTLVDRVRGVDGSIDQVKDTRVRQNLSEDEIQSIRRGLVEKIETAGRSLSGFMQADPQIGEFENDLGVLVQSFDGLRSLTPFDRAKNNLVISTLFDNHPSNSGIATGTIRPHKGRFKNIIFDLEAEAADAGLLKAYSSRVGFYETATASRKGLHIEDAINFIFSPEFKLDRQDQVSWLSYFISEMYKTRQPAKFSDADTAQLWHGVGPLGIVKSLRKAHVIKDFYMKNYRRAFEKDPSIGVEAFEGQIHIFEQEQAYWTNLAPWFAALSHLLATTKKTGQGPLEIENLVRNALTNGKETDYIRAMGDMPWPSSLKSVSDKALYQLKWLRKYTSDPTGQPAGIYRAA